MGNPYIFTLVWIVATISFIVFASYGVGSIAKAIVKQMGWSKIRQENVFAGYLFTSPWIVGFFIFVVAPMLVSLYWGFTNYRIGFSTSWVGLSNYQQLIFRDIDFRGSLVNTLFLTIIGLPVEIAVALLLAVMLNQRLRGEKVFRMAFYLPVVLGFNTAVLLSWRLMLSAGYGIINQMIRSFSQVFPPFGYLNRAFIYLVEITNAFFLGFNNNNYTLFKTIIADGFPAANRVPLWLQDPLWTKASVVLILAWGCGTMMLIFLAGLNNVPKELQEAAEVDGANGWVRFWRISFPLITPYIFYNLVVGMIAMLQIFEPIYVLYRDNQPLARSAYSVVYYLYTSTFALNQMGYGSAISWIVLIIALIVTVIQFWLQKRWVNYDLY